MFQALVSKAGARGAVVEIYEKPYPAFEVEFFDEDWEPLGTISMRPDEIASCRHHPKRNWWRKKILINHPRRRGSKPQRWCDPSPPPTRPPSRGLNHIHIHRQIGRSPRITPSCTSTLVPTAASPRTRSWSPHGSSTTALPPPERHHGGNVFAQVPASLNSLA